MVGWWGLRRVYFHWFFVPKNKLRSIIVPRKAEIKKVVHKQAGKNVQAKK